MVDTKNFNNDSKTNVRAKTMCLGRRLIIPFQGVKQVFGDDVEIIENKSIPSPPDIDGIVYWT